MTSLSPDPNRRPWLSLEGVTLVVGDRRAFENTTWHIRRGEQWAIVGANGSGKSLLVATLSGRIRPVVGRVRHHYLQGTAQTDAAYGFFRPGTLAVISTSSVQELADAVSPYHQARWHGSFGTESPGVDEWLSLERILQRNPFEVIERPMDAAEFERRRRSLIDLVGIGPLLGRKLVQLSSGELRKVLLTRAALGNPKLLVLDEPFVGLDAGTRAAMPRILDALVSTGLTLCIATARPSELPQSVTHVLAVRDLSVAYAGPRAAAPAFALHTAAPTSTVAVGARQRRPSRPEFASRIPLVEMRGVRVRYGAAVVLDDVDLRIYSDENWAILGPNGAGKSALCSLILADNPQSYANDITLFGRRRGSGESIWDIKQRLGWMSPEIVAHYPRSVRCLDVVCSGWFQSLGLYRLPNAHQHAAAESWLERFGLAADMERPLGRLSHGQQRLVLVARALVSDPWLLVLDEPCQGLDRAHAEPLLAAVDEAAADGRSRVVYVTHHLDELPRCITHVLELAKGRVVRAGARSAVLG